MYAFSRRFRAERTANTRTTRLFTLLRRGDEEEEDDRESFEEEGDDRRNIDDEPPEDEEDDLEPPTILLSRTIIADMAKCARLLKRSSQSSRRCAGGSWGE
jgi:hypothetical protein